jgi:hypothetical protein
MPALVALVTFYTIQMWLSPTNHNAMYRQKEQPKLGGSFAFFTKTCTFPSSYTLSNLDGFPASFQSGAHKTLYQYSQPIFLNKSNPPSGGYKHPPAG